jgi:hypothetical protein
MTPPKTSIHAHPIAQQHSHDQVSTLLLVNSITHTNYLLKAIIFLYKMGIFTKSKDIDTIHL